MSTVPWKGNLFGLNLNQMISRITAFLNGKLTGILNIKNMVDGHLSWPRGSSIEVSNFSELKAREPWSLWQEAWIMNLACSSWCLGARCTFHVQRPVKLKDAEPGFRILLLLRFSSPRFTFAVLLNLRMPGLVNRLQDPPASTFLVSTFHVCRVVKHTNLRPGCWTPVMSWSIRFVGRGYNFSFHCPRLVLRSTLSLRAHL